MARDNFNRDKNFSTGRNSMTNRPYGSMGPEEIEDRRDRNFGNMNFDSSGFGRSESSRSGWDDEFRDSGWRSTRWGGTERTSRGEHYGKGPRGWRRSDENINEDASEALYHDHQIDASDIEVTTKDGIITLKGTVDNRETKRAAERCVENINGVEDVQNELLIERGNNVKDLSKATGKTSESKASFS